MVYAVPFSLNPNFIPLKREDFFFFNLLLQDRVRINAGLLVTGRMLCKYYY